MKRTENNCACNTVKKLSVKFKYFLKQLKTQTEKVNENVIKCHSKHYSLVTFMFIPEQ